MTGVSTDPADLAVRRATRTALTPDVVLDAALTLFARRGYHGTALSEIAEVLGVSPAAARQRLSRARVAVRGTDRAEATAPSGFAP